VVTAVLVTVLGLAAAFMFALAAFFQQRVARATEPRGHSVITAAWALMSTLLRNRKWLIAWGVNMAGFATQAVALHLGSVAVVQPLLAAQLIFVVVFSSLERRRWPAVQDIGSSLAICSGLVVILVVVRPSLLEGMADRARVVLACLAAVALIVVGVPIAARMSQTVLSLVTAAFAGVCFAMTGVFLKMTTTDLVEHGIAYTAKDWVGYALAASTLLGLVLGQAAFANGPLPWAATTKDTVNPLASYAIGVLAFPVSVPTDPASLAWTAVAGALLVAGALGLAFSPSAHLWLRRPAELVPASDDIVGP
jgi:drug/metabolite transporter (DMT)-like permease